VVTETRTRKTGRKCSGRQTKWKKVMPRLLILE
jgi:hypothetical protein